MMMLSNTLTESSSVLMMRRFILHSDVTYSPHICSVGRGCDIMNSLFRILRLLTTCLDQSYQAREILSEEMFIKIPFTETKMVPTVTDLDSLKSPYNPTDRDPSEVTADEVPATTCSNTT